MKISVTIYSLNQYFRQGKMNVKGFIEYCGSLGVDAVDLGYYWRDEEEEVKLVPDWLRENNLELGAYIVNNDFAQEEEKRKEQISLVKHGIERASQLKTEILRIFVGDVKPDFPDYQAARDILISSFKEVSSFAKDRGITLALENHSRLCAKTDQILDLLNGVNSPNLKLNLDIGNFLKVNEDPVSSVRKLAHLAVHTHIKDFKKVKERIVPTVLGEGDVDLDSCLRILKENGYQGYLSLEYEAKIDSKTGVERGVDVLNKSLQRISF
ncbi:sugar phosphate isomerase/epimerase [Candidatus Aerophobetes bacterium]|uniref:Sugar phosphate isomerase/epimerase n=1 Tax=Aerophobetes bacterium TaxID=2030807 RepID=A0A523RPI2_UNCAE|nr:MAG: sugar phosphate isomerase/epimerase [Candidatus Aerophobetes bacterium]